MKYLTKQYLELLEQSLEFLKYYNTRYNTNLNNIKTKKKIHYHIFTFAMITFSIKDRLKTDFPRNSKYETFFELGNKKYPIKKTPAGIVHELANEWKHSEGFNTRQHFSINKNGTKVEIRLPQNHKHNSNDNNLIDIFEKAQKDILTFCKSNNYL